MTCKEFGDPVDDTRGVNTNLKLEYIDRRIDWGIERTLGS
jgi:hypothetical protein